MAFTEYRQELLLRHVRWASGIAFLLTPVGALVREGAGSSGQLSTRLAVTFCFLLIHASTYLKVRSSASGVWQSLLVTFVGGVGSTVLTLERGHSSAVNPGIVVIILGCGLLFPWRLREMALACGGLTVLFLLPPLLSTPPPDFPIWVYLHLTMMVIAMVGSALTYSLREKEFLGRAALEARTRELSQTSSQLRSSLVKLEAMSDQVVKAEKLAMLQTLLEGLAHEVRNPLNAIANSSLLLRRGTARIAGSVEASLVQVIEEAAGRIGSVVDELTVMSRTNGGGAPTLWSPAESVDAALRILGPRCQHLEIEREVDAERRLTAHGVQLDLVVMNLLDNAIRAMPKGGKLTLSATWSAEGLSFIVRDQGEGIAPEILPRIFDPFFTTRPTGEGNGLGLHISRRIAERHGGRLEVETQRGRGSSFTLFLPHAPRVEARE